ncbi:hypothetical protein [Neobacillus bataviensis]|uniref:hypothetical protein n=1 Tax=Neobacillus bataviensis TaxID=220685 RepID=UPI001CBA93BD|nr:hypothetical protein [Neobacillus bataviensis]
MTERSKVTCVYLTVNDRGYGDGYSAGCELWKEDSVYCIFSLYLSKAKYKNKTKALRHVISLVLSEIDEQAEVILFYSPMKHFFQVKRLHKMTDELKKGKDVRYFKAERIPESVHALELDASMRQEDIIEHL